MTVCPDCGKPVDQTLVALDPQPKIPEWCEEGNCNLNATSLEGEWGTRHAWGYAHGPDEGWTEHAWLVTPEGFVIDPTWLDTGPGFEYAETEYDPWEATNIMNCTDCGKPVDQTCWTIATKDGYQLQTNKFDRDSINEALVEKYRRTSRQHQ